MVTMVGKLASRKSSRRGPPLPLKKGVFEHVKPFTRKQVQIGFRAVSKLLELVFDSHDVAVVFLHVTVVISGLPTSKGC
jgi:hypothetical protein